MGVWVFLKAWSLINGEPCHSLTNVAVGCVWKALQSQTVQNSGEKNVECAHHQRRNSWWTQWKMLSILIPMNRLGFPVPALFNQTYFPEATNKSLSIKNPKPWMHGSFDGLFLRKTTYTLSAWLSMGCYYKARRKISTAATCCIHQAVITPRTNQKGVLWAYRYTGLLSPIKQPSLYSFGVLVGTCDFWKLVTGWPFPRLWVDDAGTTMEATSLDAARARLHCGCKGPGGCPQKCSPFRRFTGGRLCVWQIQCCQSILVTI